jgi:transposase, IS5 family
LEGEVRANVVYREFTRIRGEKVPDAKTMVRWGKALGPEVIHEIHQRIVVLGRQAGVLRGRKLRVDTTVVETNIHYPTDSGLLGDASRVLIRTMKFIEREVGHAGEKVRDRMRAVKHRLIEIARSARERSERAKAKQKRAYQKLMATTRQVIRQAEIFVWEVSRGIKQARDPLRHVVVMALCRELEHMGELAQRVLRQTEQRVLKGNTHYREKLLSVFEEHTEAIRKGKASKPTEFGKMVKIQEAEHQIITDYEVFSNRALDMDLVMPCIEKHRKPLGRVPELVAADAAFFSPDNELRATEAGVKRIAIPNKRGRDPGRRGHQRERWFRRAQRWRVGCEGTISVLKRRHGLVRCRYKGTHGMERWVGLGVIADNLIHLGRAQAHKTTKPA